MAKTLAKIDLNDPVQVWGSDVTPGDPQYDAVWRLRLRDLEWADRASKAPQSQLRGSDSKAKPRGGGFSELRAAIDEIERKFTVVEAERDRAVKLAALQAIRAAAPAAPVTPLRDVKDLPPISIRVLDRDGNGRMSRVSATSGPRTQVWNVRRDGNGNLRELVPVPQR